MDSWAASVVWGFVGAAGLLVGGIVGMLARPKQAIVGRVMAFGAGTLIGAVTLDLTAEALEVGGEHAFMAGLLSGGAVFYLADRLFLQDEARGMGAAKSIVLGSLLDGVPESMAIGVTIAAQGRVPIALVAASFIGNLPEGLVPSVDMVEGGRTRRQVLRMWLVIAAISGAAALAGYAILAALPGSVDAFVQAFAAGAVLAMLSMTLIPEALERAGRLVGVWTVVGYGLAVAAANATR